MTSFAKNTSAGLAVLLLAACAPLKPEAAVPSPGAVTYFKNYVAHDGPDPDTLPVFLAACRGDVAAMTDIFGNYRRYGSGDNEAWGDVPDVILREAGDRAYADFVLSAKPAVRTSALEHLGFPGSSLYADPELARKYPRTTYLQARLTNPPPKDGLLPPKPEGLDWPPR